MEDDAVQIEAAGTDDMVSDTDPEEIVAGKKKDDENGIIAILIG